MAVHSQWRERGDWLRRIDARLIAEIRSMFHGDYSIRLRTGAEIPLGRTFRDRLEAVLGRSL